MKLPQLYTVGRVAGKHGFSGEVSLLADDEQYLRTLKKGDFLFVEFDKKGVPFLIESISAGGRIVKLADIDSENTASALLGKNILSPDEQNRETHDWDSLNDFHIQISGSNLKGQIISIEEYPAGPMIVATIKGNEVLIPAVEEWIEEIDEVNSTITISIPEGLLDL